MVKFGNWLFHYRNFLFPLFYAFLFIPSSPVIANEKVTLMAGLVTIFSGILVRSVTVGLDYIVRGGKNRRVYAEGLVTGGIYTICRNPMYLGNILLVAGFSIMADSLLFTVIFFPLFILFYIAIIKAEEDFLYKKFGAEFLNFKNNVNALLPDLRALGKAFEGQSFNLKKVLRNEYNGYYYYLSGILLLLLVQKHLELNTFIIAFAALTVIYVVIKVMKRRRLLED